MHSRSWAAIATTRDCSASGGAVRKKKRSLSSAMFSLNEVSRSEVEQQAIWGTRSSVATCATSSETLLAAAPTIATTPSSSMSRRASGSPRRALVSSSTTTSSIGRPGSGPPAALISRAARRAASRHPGPSVPRSPVSGVMMPIFTESKEPGGKVGCGPHPITSTADGTMRRAKDDT